MASALHMQQSTSALKKLPPQTINKFACVKDFRNSVCPERLALLRQPKAIHRSKRSSIMVRAARDIRVMVKLSVAASSGKLDLSDCDLKEVPAEVCNLKDLEARLPLPHLHHARFSRLATAVQCQISAQSAEELSPCFCINPSWLSQAFMFCVIHIAIWRLRWHACTCKPLSSSHACIAGLEFSRQSADTAA